METDQADLIIIGAGPAGLMAAEVAAARGHRVHVYDAMASPGRKFLLAGRGGLNLTHSESRPLFQQRYGAREAEVASWLDSFDAAALRAWVHRLGVETFVGTSGRVFPTGMKGAPLLRAWLAALGRLGVTLHMRHKWTGWDDQGQLIFDTPAGSVYKSASAVVVATGGASWPRLGSDGSGLALLEEKGVSASAFEPANCGFEVNWSDHFATRYAGTPVKNINASVAVSGRVQAAWLAGEAMVSRSGIEGGVVYGLSGRLRDALHANPGENVTLAVDLLPDLELDTVHRRLARGRGSKSWSSFLQSQLGLKGVKSGLLREWGAVDGWGDSRALAEQIKRVDIPVLRPRPIAQAISSAGGIRFEALGHDLACHALPGVFCAGELLDWEAPTGGYLLTAVMASGVRAGEGAAAYLEKKAARA